MDARLLLVPFLAGACAGSAPTPNAPILDDTVHLNHVLAVLDPETMAAITSDPFLRDELAATHTSTTHADGESWTGFYVVGRETYLELFTPDPELPAGAAGFGLSIDTEGGLARLAARLKGTGTGFETGMRTRQAADGTTAPWFQTGALLPERPDARLSLWVMEYVPEYVARLPGRNGSRDISRTAYQARQYQPERLFQNVRAARLVMPPAERDGFAAALAAYGWKVRREGEDAVAVAGDGVELRVGATGGATGLTELRLTLGRPAARREIVLGRSTLTVGPGPEAVWVFAP